jgi:hypothetical protein
MKDKKTREKSLGVRFKKYKTVRHVTGTGLGLLEEIPRSGVQMSALT